MAKASFYGTGRRKKSVARVYLTPGTGVITVNKRSIDEYFGLETLKVVVRQPLTLTETVDKFDVNVTVRGGGFYRPGWCYPSRHLQSSAAGRSRVSWSTEEGWFPDKRSSYEGKKEAGLEGC